MRPSGWDRAIPLSRWWMPMVCWWSRSRLSTVSWASYAPRLISYTSSWLTTHHTTDRSVRPARCFAGRTERRWDEWADHEVATGALGRQRLGDGVALLLLALTGSAAQSELMLGRSPIAQLLGGVPAGALTDRWNGKTIMLSCEAIQVIAAVSVGAVL